MGLQVKQHLLIELLEQHMSDVKEKLNDGINSLQIIEVESICGKLLPDSFVKLYEAANGENTYIGVMLGFDWLSIEEIITSHKALMGSAYEILSDRPDKIKEGAYKKGWIPFAHDGSGSYLVMDLDPDKDGMEGQIITIDREDPNSYIIANGMNELITLIQQSLVKGMFFLSNEEEPHFEWESGHLFNDISRLADNNQENAEVEIDEYFEQFYEGKVHDHFISKSELEKTKSLFLKDPDMKDNKISLDIFKYMSNLKELIIHITNIEDFSPFLHLSSLRKLVIGVDTLTSGDYKYFTGLNRLKELTICNISLDSIKELAGCKGLSCLRLYKVSGFDFNEIGCFTKITELELEAVSCEDLGFLSKLKKLQKLSLKRIEIPNLKFLDELTNLTSFETDGKAIDESNVIAIHSLSKLTELKYPIRDLNLIRPCSNLVEICIDASNYIGIEILGQTKIRHVSLYGATSEEHAESTIKTIEQYCDLASYQWEETW